jgi:hypothetical protein
MSCYQNQFYMFIEMLDEIKEKLPPKYTPQKIHFLPETCRFKCVFTQHIVTQIHPLPSYQ